MYTIPLVRMKILDHLSCTSPSLNSSFDPPAWEMTGSSVCILPTLAWSSPPSIGDNHVYSFGCADIHTLYLMVSIMDTCSNKRRQTIFWA